jgi:glyoxylase-like metal-dependent hydrolase (beta-lactamase superfamily II)
MSNSHLAILEVSSSVAGRTSVVYPTLLWDSEHTILVDAGFPGQLDLIRAAVDQAGVPFTHLDTLIVTHHDLDHIGCLAPILAERPGAIHVLAHEVEKGYIDGSQTPLKLARMEANLEHLPEQAKAFYTQMKAGFQHSFAPVDQTLRDGEVLPYCGGITVVHTPGHTHGHICLYLQEHKALIAGDTLIVQDGKLAMGPAEYNFDTDTARKSLEKLSRYEIRTVISYHSGRFDGNANEQIASLRNA